MSADDLGRRTAEPLTASLPFRRGNEPAGFTVGDFWQWSASDLLSNALRGVVAEFIVAKALGLDTDCARTEWDLCDLRTPTGQLVEVRSAAYLQSWAQSKLSSIRFSISARRGWNAETNTSAPTPTRAADVYVFALLAHQAKATVDPLDLEQWRFRVMSRPDLERDMGQQKGITETKLLSIAGPSVSFAEVASAVARLEEASPRR